MTEEEFQTNLAILENNEVDFLSSKLKISGEFFQNAVEENCDISIAIPKLIQAFNECNQVPAMEPIARAVTLYYLQKKDFNTFRKLVNSAPFSRYYISALLYYAQKRFDVFLFKDSVLDFYTKDQYLANGILGIILKRNTTERFEILLEAICKHPRAKSKINSFLLKAREFEVDLRKALPYLVNLIKRNSSASDIAACLCWYVESNIDITLIYSELISILNSRKNISLRAKICYALAYYSLSKDDWKFIDNKLSAKEYEIRYNCLNAIQNFYYSRRVLNSKSYKDRLLTALLDKDPRIGKFILSSIESGLERNKNLLPSDNILSSLVQGLNLLEYASKIKEVLYLLSLQSSRNANKILSMLASNNASSSLYSYIEKITNSEVECKVCAKIPSPVTYSHQFLIPNAIKSLKIIKDSSLRKCPQCNTYYSYSYEDQWDDMSHSETWSIVRLSPYEVIDLLKGEDKERYAEFFPVLMEKMKGNINHPVKKIKEEATLFWVKYLLRNKDWINLKLILESDDLDTLISALVVLAEYDAAKTIHPLEFELLKLLATKRVSYNVAKVLANYFIFTKDLVSIEKFLCSKEENIVLATLQCLSRIDKFQPNDTNSYIKALLALIRHRNADIRSYSHIVLNQVADFEINLILNDFNSILQQKQIIGVNEVLSTIQKLSSKEIDLSSTIPYIGKFLHNPVTNWHATQAVKALAMREIDITPIYKDIEIELRNRRNNSKNDLIHIIDMAFSYGYKEQEMIQCISPFLNKDEYRYSSIGFLEKAFSYGMDISPVIKSLKKAIRYKGLDSYRDSAIKVLTIYYAGNKNWKKVRELLVAKDKHIVGAATTAIDTLVEKGLDITAIIELIQLNQNHPYWFIRDVSKRILFKLEKLGG